MIQSTLASKFNKGDAVAISGNVESYNGKLHLIIVKINRGNSTILWKIWL